MKRGVALAMLIVMLFGAAKMGFEQQLTEEHRAAFFHGAHLNLDLRQQVGQLGFLAALSGFRSIVADLLWIQAHTAWQNTEWGRMALLLNDVTALQPRNVMFWDMAAWHMGWNASVYAIEDRKQPRLALRVKAQREYFKLAENFLIRGIENNPDRYELYERLGTLYKEKFKDHLKASQWYDKAKDFPHAPTFEKRFAAYELSYCPGKEQEAYDKLVKLYKMGQQEWLPTLLTRLQFLEEKLNIPVSQRVYNPPEKK